MAVNGEFADGVVSRRVLRYRQADLGEAERESVLAARVSAVLAFVDSRGYPRQLPCWFLWEAPAFYITSQADKFHVRRLKENARASVCVEVSEETQTARRNGQVKGFGEIEILEDEAGWSDRIRQKYLGDVAAAETSVAIDRVVLRLQPLRLSAHGGAIEYG
jgi:nitroimidazol reductase NimA-like FMN-containing flavoprotein (pyridoxamine 5'-phosphate oxidase superfamily)